ncbi:Uu.00g030140.m01.CDS01 [Anthostomella pinea]|uniref:Uu.00g030140.m01.CDS01 n=1 Tax=Anthostomella pinea TaxID=933095 RepID=A0AAI8YCV6_9PEZI|nr:Uu.00g030140.m01.CDS01 [Anthostomella pinea]
MGLVHLGQLEASSPAASKLQQNVSQQNKSHTTPQTRSLNHRASSLLSTTAAKPALRRPPSSASLASSNGNGNGSGNRGTRAATTIARPVAKTAKITATTAATSPTARITPTIPSTAAIISRTAPPTRTPLRLRDHNAAPAPVTRSLLKQTGNMPHEPPANTHGNGKRPQMPLLSAAAARGTNRTPVTPKMPKIAASKAPQTPTIATTTPLNRRTQQQHQQRPTIANLNRDSTSSHRTSHHEEPVPVLAPHLISNITPRSGSRQNRVDSASSTPNGTPIPERSEEWDPKSSFGGIPSPSPQFEADSTRRPTLNFNPINLDINGHGRQEAQPTTESKFFHASDVKNTRPTSVVARPALPPKGSSFFYANGNNIENKLAGPAPFVPVLAHTHDNVPSKFMYANGAPELRTSPPPLISRGSGSVVSTASKAPTSRPGTNPPASGHAFAPRPGSPIKLASQPQLASLKHHNVPLGAGNRSQMVSPPQLGPSPPGLTLRRSSTATSRSGGHSRSGSMVSGDHALGITKPLASPLSELGPPLNVSARPAPLTLASIIQAAEEFEEIEEVTSPDEARSGLQSPTKSSHSTADPISELVANARRERKVQDLQITNASLEAINRTLERQLRKQTAELRRYQRLSRSGRLSIASTTKSSRVPSETLSEHQATGLDLSDLSEEGSDMEDELDEESFSDSDSMTSSLSPSVIAERDAKHRKKDEKRLQLDLSKHQELLIDSQKINQSIKRCLDWTEELINDGKKALAYKVRVSDIELGGRVLDPLDEEDETTQTLNDPHDDDTIRLGTNISEDPERVATWGEEPQDRDSGVELPADKT